MHDQFLSSILENIKEGVVVCDAQGTLTYFNRRTIEMQGLPPHPIPAEQWSEFYQLYYPDGETLLKEVDLPLLRALNESKSIKAEVLIAPKGRSPLLVEVNAQPLFDEKNIKIGAIATMLDITETKRASDERLKFLDKMTSLLIGNMDHEEIIYQIAVAGIPTLADGCMIDLVGADGINRLVTKHADPKVEEYLKTLQRNFPPRYDSPQPTSRVIRSGQPELLPVIDSKIIAEHTMNKDHADLIHKVGIRSHLAVPMICRGNIIGALNLLITTDRKSFDNDDLTMAMEISRRAAIAIENARLYSQAQKAIKQRDEFISVASHELKTPITSLKLQLEAIARSISKSHLERIDHEYLQKFSASSIRQLDRLTRLVEDMLDISRLSTGKLALDLRVADLSDITKEVLGRFTNQLKDLNIPLEVQLEEDLIIECDPFRIEQVITNLMTNAIRYGEKKPISLRLKRENGTACFSLKDSGRGIDPADHSRIFNRFERAIAATDISGLGLGLFISRQILEEHKGKIWVQSQLGHGSTFNFTLPVIA